MVETEASPQVAQSCLSTPVPSSRRCTTLGPLSFDSTDHYCNSARLALQVFCLDRSLKRTRVRARDTAHISQTQAASAPTCSEN